MALLLQDVIVVQWCPSRVVSTEGCSIEVMYKDGYFGSDMTIQLINSLFTGYGPVAEQLRMAWLIQLAITRPLFSNDSNQTFLYKINPI